MQSVERATVWLDRVREPSLSALVIVQMLAMFLVGPLEDAGLLRLGTVNLFVLPMTLISIFIAGRGIGRWLIIIAFGITFVVYMLRVFFVNETLFTIVETAAALLFLITVSLIIGRTVFAAGPVTLYRIQGAVSIYLNMALAFGLLDSLLSSLLPDAYSNMPAGPTHLGVMIYFSLETITTTGYGDVAPVHPFARAMANLEAVTGQLYMAILIGTLVGLHVSHRTRRGP